MPTEQRYFYVHGERGASLDLKNTFLIIATDGRWRPHIHRSRGTEVVLQELSLLLEN